MQKNIVAGIVLGVAVVTAGTILLVRQAQMPEQSTERRTYTVDTVPPALNEPVFSTVGVMDAVLGDELWGMDVEYNGAHYYFPVQIVNWHNVANVRLGEMHAAVTYDPLTGSSAVFALPPEMALQASGTIFDNSMLLADGSGNFWWQTTGEVFEGVGAQLTEYPFALYTWADWKEAFPGGKVLSDETGYAREYGRHPYGGYDASSAVYFPVVNDDTRYDAIKAMTFGVIVDGQAVGFPLPMLRDAGEATVMVGDVAVVGTYDEERDVVTVTRDNEALPTRTMFWFAWASAYPNTLIPIIATADVDE